MHSPLPLTQDIVLVGGGHAHALVLRQWAMNPLPGARLTVINPGPVAPYTGMLPGAIAGHYLRDDMLIDLVRLGRLAGARLILDTATGIDLAQKIVHLSSGRQVPYDVASVDIGIQSDLPLVPGHAAFGVSAKPLGNYFQAWEAFVANAPSAPHVTIIGGGVGGVELALASHHRLVQSGRQPVITVIERGATALPAISEGTRRTLLAELGRAGIALLTQVSAVEITRDAVMLSDGQRLASDFTLAVAGGRAQDWLRDTGLDLHDGFVTVSPTLQSSDPSVFAAGDCAHLAFAPRPKAGVFAVRAAPVLFHNLRTAVSKGTMQRFSPQRDYLKLISLGDRRAAADKFGLRAGGAWLWWLKDRIDQKFMTMLREFPAMPQPALPNPHAKGLSEALGKKPMCGGCGAKVGAGALSAALQTLPAPVRSDVISGPGDDAAILAVGQAVQVMTTDHLRAFTHDPALMARLTAIHALGDVWAMGADPQIALAQITLPRLSAPLQARMLAEVMEAAASVFRAAGADIAGGHTSVGDELTIGFTVTGLAKGQITPKSGAQVGDVILLTKPIGTGTILAAEMAMSILPSGPGQPMLGEAWVQCIESMSRPLGPAAAILRNAATAMTDVTGFGLAGHLWEMVRGADHGRGVSAELDLSKIPVLPGALALAAAGMASTLAPANRAALGWNLDAPPGPITDLLIDPQTCGGLMATVPAAMAERVIEELARLGERATPIGHIGPGPARIVAL